MTRAYVFRYWESTGGGGGGFPPADGGGDALDGGEV
jgi:hypothetical protein